MTAAQIVFASLLAVFVLTLVIDTWLNHRKRNEGEFLRGALIGGAIKHPELYDWSKE